MYNKYVAVLISQKYLGIQVNSTYMYVCINDLYVYMNKKRWAQIVLLRARINIAQV